MRITREQPRVEYVLRLDYTDLHELYHFMLERSRRVEGVLPDVEERFFEALREHA